VLAVFTFQTTLLLSTYASEKFEHIYMGLFFRKVATTVWRTLVRTVDRLYENDLCGRSVLQDRGPTARKAGHQYLYSSLSSSTQRQETNTTKYLWTYNHGSNQRYCLH
jgi:plasmid stabilization system protein ParE